MKLLSLVVITSLAASAPAVAQTTYTYDALGRLVETRETGDHTKTVKYTYDPADNRTKVKSGNAAPVANDNSYFLMTTGSTWSGVLSVLGNDTDADMPDDTLSIVSVSGSAYASASTTVINLTAAPVGWHNFSYTMKDSVGATSTADVYAQVVYCNPICELDP